MTNITDIMVTMTTDTIPITDRFITDPAEPLNRDVQWPLQVALLIRVLQPMQMPGERQVIHTGTVP
jgi:hypothetical protein